MQYLRDNMPQILRYAVICQLLFCVAVGPARPQGLEEYKIKAAFVYNFTKLIEWPETTFDHEGEIFKIAVFGNKHIKESFGTIDGKISSGRIISIRYPDPNALNYKEMLAESQIVFISRQTSFDQVLKILSDVGKSPVLTIGEVKNFSRAGGILQFFTRDDHLHFEVNIRKAEAHQLKFSSRLLKLAVVVNEK